MASSLLAVDDSVTMRKIFEMTFAGTDLHVATADGPEAALARLGDKPDVVLLDAGESAGAGRDLANGYALCKRIKEASPSTRVLLLSSKQHPYDAAAGTQAGADDQTDKPFDTQQLIDRVRKLLAAPSVKAAPAVSAAPIRPAAAPQAPVAPAAPVAQSARPRTLAYAPTGTPAAPAAAPAPAAAFAPKPAFAAPAARSAAPTPAQGNIAQARPTAGPVPSPTMPAMEVSAASTKAPAVAAQLSGELTSKLEGLGLTPAQVDAVVALSREVVERAVWEVVPVLAETIIKEEIARLTK